MMAAFERVCILYDLQIHNSASNQEILFFLELEILLLGEANLFDIPHHSFQSVDSTDIRWIQIQYINGQQNKLLVGNIYIHPALAVENDMQLLFDNIININTHLALYRQSNSLQIRQIFL